MLSEQAIELAEKVLSKSDKIRTAFRKQGLEFLSGHIVDAVWPNQVLVRGVILAGLEAKIVTPDEYQAAFGCFHL